MAWAEVDVVVDHLPPLLHLLATLPRHVVGEVWEVGTFRGTNAREMAKVLAETGIRPLRCFDTFAGRPRETGPDAGCSSTRFTETTLAEVQARLAPWPFALCQPGTVPASFAGLEGTSLAFAYVDLDLYAGTRAALAFIVPRLVPGGVVVVDDFRTQEWPGVTAAIAERSEPWALLTRTQVWWRRPA